VGQDLRLRHRHHGGACREQRTDTQIDVARDNDEHHARRHDRDRHRLNGQVEQVARRQESAIREEVESDAQHHQRADHAEQSAVDFKLLKKAAFSGG